MADAAIDSDDNVEVEALPKKGGLSGKKLVLILAPVLLFLLGGAGAFFTGALDGLLGKDGHESAAVEAKAGPQVSVFMELPEMLVNLNGSGRKSSFLKLLVSLEIGSEADKAALQKVMPRIVDSFQVYLRELRVDDLQGSAGLQRLREELLLRVNAAAHPVEVRDVLFKEMLVQ
jgi:flagellar FliL protein